MLSVCLSVCLSIHLIGNYGVALRRTCYTIFYIVPWCPAVYKTSTASIQSIGFTVTGISFCSSELLISFACDLELLRWFLSIALRIPTAQDFLRHQRVHVHNERNFSQAKPDSGINVRFLLNEHGDLYLLLHNNSVHIVLLNLKGN